VSIAATGTPVAVAVPLDKTLPDAKIHVNELVEETAPLARIDPEDNVAVEANNAPLARIDPEDSADVFEN
jgi:hypothetical protein